MKIKIKENQYVGLTNLLVENRNKVFENFIRETIRSVYENTPYWGKIEPTPENDCETGEGVIGIFPHSETDIWSILNRFDTNTRVHSKIKELWSSDVNEGNKISFENWIIENKDELFGKNGLYTQSLVDINKITIDKGIENEEYAVKIIKSIYGQNAKRFCSGSIQDTKNGTDLLVKVGGSSLGVQVKPLKSVKSITDIDGDTYFEIDATNFYPYSYKEKNVQVFMFVNNETKQYISFENKRNKIVREGTQHYTKVKFYEPYLFTNISNFETEYREYDTSKSDELHRIFNTSSRRLENLEYKKKEIQRLIDLEMKRLSNQNPQ